MNSSILVLTMNTVDPYRLESLGSCSALGALVARQCAASPQHAAFLARRFGSAAPGELQLCDALASEICKLAGAQLESFIAGYDFICDIQRREELYFRRHQAYRLKTAEQAAREVYHDPRYMQCYMRGLLMTQVFWANHTASMDFYIREFLPGNPPGYRLLEIGPGHGLLFSRAAADERAGMLVGWDLSPQSIAETRNALASLGVTRPCRLEVRDLFDARGCADRFDAVVFSEILEHLEQPGRALETLRFIMRPGARIYINVPVNSPAPDHLFLLRSPEEAVAFVESHGFQIHSKAFFPATNYSLPAARKHSLSISVCMVAVRPAD